jgi:hypothetical protein
MKRREEDKDKKEINKRKRVFDGLRISNNGMMMMMMMITVDLQKIKLCASNSTVMNQNTRTSLHW